MSKETWNIRKRGTVMYVTSDGELTQERALALTFASSTEAMKAAEELGRMYVASGTETASLQS